MKLTEKYLVEYKATAIFDGKKKNVVEVYFDFEIPIHRIPEWMRKWGLDPKLGGNKWGRIKGNFKGFWFEVDPKERWNIIHKIAKMEKISTSMKLHHVD